MTQQNTFVIGGCRSGKSGHALKLAEKYRLKHRLYIATCVPHDPEMHDRVARHRKERGDRWSTVEEPLELPEVILSNSSPDAVLLVDCLTLWISNLLLENDKRDQALVLEPTERLLRSLKNAKGPVIMGDDTPLRDIAALRLAGHGFKRGFYCR